MQQIDGRPVTAADLQPLALMGLAHFTTMRVTRGHVRGLGLHLQRLERDSRRLFDAALDSDLVRERIRSALTDEPADVIVRVTVFDPALTLARPGADAAPRILVSPRPAGSGSPAPHRVRSVRFVREHAGIKHAGLFGALQARRDAQRLGYDDAVFVDASGRLIEGPTWNLGFVSGGRVVWPAGEALAGVTRSLLQRIAGDAAAAVTRDELPAMDAAFATGAGIGIRPLRAIDDAEWPTDHPALAQLRQDYAQIEPETV